LVSSEYRIWGTLGCEIDFPYLASTFAREGSEGRRSHNIPIRIREYLPARLACQTAPIDGAKSPIQGKIQGLATIFRISKPLWYQHYHRSPNGPSLELNVHIRQQLEVRLSMRVECRKSSRQPAWESEGEAMDNLRYASDASTEQLETVAVGLPQWFAIQTRARHEKRISTELEQKGITAYAPTMRETHRWSDRAKVVEVPLFSCYVFVKVIAMSAPRLEILKTAGVFRFVSVNGVPAPIPDSQIESLKTVLASRLPVSACGFLKLGQRVRICGGSLDGIEGTLVEVRGEHRLVLSVELIRQSISVTIDRHAVELIH